jgi:hypothetical protein
MPRRRAEHPVFESAGKLARRVRVWWRAPDLDRELAEGTHPWRSQELSLRAAQLTSPRRRTRFANELEAAVAQVRKGPVDIRVCVPLQRAGIVASAEELLELAAALRSSSVCLPRAAALVSYLLYDARSPLYFSETAATPASIARAALAGLATDQPDGVAGAARSNRR